jgi:hypothetical protein
MDAYERQQFDFLLTTAVERYVERLEQRNEGPLHALARLRVDPEHPNVRLSEFVRAVFTDFLLDTPDGACFVLRALPRRQLPAPAPGLIADMLQSLARAAFADLLRQKAEELLEQHVQYG